MSIQLLLFFFAVLIIVPPLAPIAETLSFLGLNWTNDYFYDVLTCVAFAFFFLRLAFSNHRITNLQLMVNKTYFYLIILGLIPVAIGIWNDNSHIFYAYRFFIYFVWVPFIMQLFTTKRVSLLIVRSIVVINFVSVAVALARHLQALGFAVYYMPFNYGINLFVCLILLLLSLHGIYLFKHKIIFYIIAIVCLLALVLDGSRRIYLGFIFGNVFIFLSLLRSRSGIKMKSQKIAIFAIYFAVFFVLVHQQALSYVTDRLTSLALLRPTYSGFRRDFSLDFRHEALLIGIQKIMEHPFVGIGTGYDADLAGMLRVVGGKFGYEGGSPHNFFINSARYYGIPILLLVVYFIFHLLIKAWNFAKRQADSTYAELRLVSFGMIIAFISFFTILGYTGYGGETTLCIWFFLGMALGATNQLTLYRNITEVKEDIPMHEAVKQAIKTYRS